MPASDIVIRGAREHNLRDVSVTLPRNKLIVMTGVSGSGKSSLAFDTLYAEGQRRYVESLSSYARQFLGQMPKPEVDSITGLAPSIAIQQKSSGRNPRSTVGTITEIYDYLRVLFARVGTPSCHQCGKPITAQTREHILDSVLRLPEGTKYQVLAPLIQRQKGEYKDLFEDLLKRGFLRARVDGQSVQLTDDLQLDKQMKHTIDVVIDRLVAGKTPRARVAEAIESALNLAKGRLVISREPAEELASRSDRPPLAPALRREGKSEGFFKTQRDKRIDRVPQPSRGLARDTRQRGALHGTERPVQLGVLFTRHFVGPLCSLIDPRSQQADLLTGKPLSLGRHLQSLFESGDQPHERTVGRFAGNNRRRKRLTPFERRRLQIQSQPATLLRPVMTRQTARSKDRLDVAHEVDLTRGGGREQRSLGTESTGCQVRSQNESDQKSTSHCEATQLEQWAYG